MKHVSFNFKEFLLYFCCTLGIVINVLCYSILTLQNLLKRQEIFDHHLSCSSMHSAELITQVFVLSFMAASIHMQISRVI